MVRHWRIYMSRGLAPLILNFGTGGLMFSYKPRPLYPRIYWVRGWVNIRGGLDVGDKINIFLPWLEIHIRFLGHPVHCVITLSSTLSILPISSKSYLKNSVPTSQKILGVPITKAKRLMLDWRKNGLFWYIKRKGRSTNSRLTCGNTFPYILHTLRTGDADFRF